jgi:hypothetical protein
MIKGDEQKATIRIDVLFGELRLNCSIGQDLFQACPATGSEGLLGCGSVRESVKSKARRSVVPRPMHLHKAVQCGRDGCTVEPFTDPTAIHDNLDKNAIPLADALPWDKIRCLVQPHDLGGRT